MKLKDTFRYLHSQILGEAAVARAILRIGANEAEEARRLEDQDNRQAFAQFPEVRHAEQLLQSPEWKLAVKLLTAFAFRHESPWTTESNALSVYVQKPEYPNEYYASITVQANYWMGDILISHDALFHVAVFPKDFKETEDGGFFAGETVEVIVGADAGSVEKPYHCEFASFTEFLQVVQEMYRVDSLDPFAKCADNIL